MPEVDYSGIISIHAPREGSDLTRDHIQITQYIISIHAPREGSDSKNAQELLPNLYKKHYTTRKYCTNRLIAITQIYCDRTILVFFACEPPVEFMGNFGSHLYIIRGSSTLMVCFAP